MGLCLINGTNFTMINQTWGKQYQNNSLEADKGKAHPADSQGKWSCKYNSD